MPLEEEPYYCHEQIQIPPEFPDILKQFTKAAIRTQPKDILIWSHAYFRAMANGELPPVKDRLEMPIATQKTDTGLSPELLKTLNRQKSLLRAIVTLRTEELGPKKTLALEEIESKWKDLLIPMELFHEVCKIGNFVTACEWLHFLAISATTLRSNIAESLRLLCEILTADPECGPARITFELWKILFEYLVEIDGCVSKEHADSVIEYLNADVERQGGMIQPSNFFHSECPKIQP